MTIFGVLAHSEKVLAALRGRKLQQLTRGFPRDEKAWWIDPQGRIALFGAAVVRSESGLVVYSLDSSRTSKAQISTRSIPNRSRSASETGEQTFPASDLVSVITQISSKGAGAFAHLREDFALAYWDNSQARLFLARDHFGHKQLYLRRGGDFSLFCSEMGPMLADSSRSYEMDFESAINYLIRGLPLPGRTLAKGVEALPSAHVLIWDPPALPIVQRYWTPLSSHPEEITRKRLVAKITESLNDSIFSRLDRQGNTLLLSGGVDSSYIAAAAVKKISPDQLKTYTIQYEPSYDKNEGHYASSVARSIGARHSLVSLSPAQASVLLQEVLASPVPCSAWSAITHQRLLAEIGDREEGRLLSGLGADEVFGGYDRYLDYYFRQRHYARRWRQPEKIDWFDALLDNKAESAHRLFPGMAYFFGARQLRRSLYYPFDRIELDDYDRRFYRECRALKGDAHIFEMMIAHECQHRIPDLLMSNFEPLARAKGVLTAYPFLDPTLLSWASSIGPADRYWYENGNWWAKKLYREIASKLLPQTIVMRRRATYDSPIAEWLCEPVFGPPTLERFARSRFWQAGFLRPSLKDDLLIRAKNLPGSLRRSRRTWLEEFWAVLTLSAWFDRFVEGRK
jgi:asparagine synthase (glutamine-hydrolysing)